MLKSSTWVHLRIPFSFRLAPVYFLAWSQVEAPFSSDALLIFIILHFFLYPASNGYNSYFDKDEDSIAGVEKPPPVTDELYYVSLILDLIALGLSAMFLNSAFFICALIEGVMSKLYSHPGVRLKARPVLGWLVTGVFQGYFLFLGIQGGCSSEGLTFLGDPRLHFAGLLSTLILLGIYPITQVYQHKEDIRRGDVTMSILVGIKGTFALSLAFLFIGFLGFVKFFGIYYKNYETVLLIFVMCCLPMVSYLMYWFLVVLKDERQADYKHTMKMNLVASICMNFFYICLTLFSQRVEIIGF